MPTKTPYKFTAIPGDDFEKKMEVFGRPSKYVEALTELLSLPEGQCIAMEGILNRSAANTGMRNAAKKVGVPVEFYWLDETLYIRRSKSGSTRALLRNRNYAANPPGANGGPSSATTTDPEEKKVGLKS